MKESQKSIKEKKLVVHFSSTGEIDFHTALLQLMKIHLVFPQSDVHTESIK